MQTLAESQHQRLKKIWDLLHEISELEYEIDKQYGSNASLALTIKEQENVGEDMSSLHEVHRTLTYQVKGMQVERQKNLQTLGGLLKAIQSDGYLKEIILHEERQWTPLQQAYRHLRQTPIANVAANFPDVHSEEALHPELKKFMYEQTDIKTEFLDQLTERQWQRVTADIWWEINDWREGGEEDDSDV